MQKFIILFLFISFFNNAKTQGTWTQLSSFPGIGRHHAISFVLGDSAYIATGDNRDDFYRYDIHNDSWIQLADFPGGTRNFAIGFAVNGKGYISCGFDGANALMDMWEYDPVLDNWAQKSSSPSIGRVHPAFSVVGDRVYIGQGQQDGNYVDLDDWHEYNTTTDTWIEKTNFMTPRHHAVASTIGNAIYIGTGHHLNTMHTDWNVYNASNDSWQTLSSLPSNGRSAANAVTSNGKVYLFAGEDEMNYERFDDFWEYSPVTDTWTNFPDFPADGRWAPFMFVHNDTIYVGAGQDEVLVNRNDLWRFDFATASIEDNKLDEVTIYPNPSTNGKIQLKTHQAIEKIELIDMLGSTIYVPTDLTNLSIETTLVESGNYILRITLSNQVVTNVKVEILN